MLNELDKELTKRGHPFVRYADDCMIFCRSKRAAERILESISNFIEGKLFLKVNRDKTDTGSVLWKKFLGYSFYFDTEGKCQLRLHTKTIMKLKGKLKELTGRNNGMGYAQRKEALNLFVRGWIEYYKLARMKKILETIDKWLRRRIRMCIWKSWKNPRTRITNLIKCGVRRMACIQTRLVKELLASGL